MRLNQPGESIVVVPSSRPTARARPAARSCRRCEERFLFLLLLLRQPRLRMIYVTGRPIHRAHHRVLPRRCCPGVIPSHARARLHLVADARRLGPRRSRDKLLERPRVLGADPRAASPTARAATSCPTRRTTLERDLALALGIPLYGADPRLLPARHQDRLPAALRRGRRRPPARARGPARPSTDVVDALAGDARGAGPAMADGDRQAQRGRVRARATRSSTSRAAGAGLAGRALRRCAERRARRWRFEHADDAARRLPRAARRAAAASSRSGSSATELRSPSVQLRVTPLGEVELLSTHDQLLGGPSGQSYLGCRVPGRLRVRRARSPRQAPRRSARGSPRRACSGRFAIDFVVVRDARRRLDAVRDRAQPAQGRHDPPVPHPAVPHRRRATTRRRRCSPRPSGREKHLVATDHLESRAAARAHDRRPVRHRRRGTACTSTRRARPASSST